MQPTLRCAVTIPRRQQLQFQRFLGLTSTYTCAYTIPALPKIQTESAPRIVGGDSAVIDIDDGMGLEMLSKHVWREHT